MAIYGTNEAANLWYNEASNTLMCLGFIKSIEDPCLFIGNQTLVGLYVDNLFVIQKYVRKWSASSATNPSATMRSRQFSARI